MGNAVVKLRLDREAHVSDTSSSDALRCCGSSAAPRGRRVALMTGASWVLAGPLKCLGAAASSAAAGQTPPPVADAELRLAAQRGELCSTSNATGAGLRGEYFARDSARGELLLTRTDSTVDFDNGFEWPAPLAGRRPGSARWTGWVKPSIAGRYRFHAEQAAATLVVAQQPMIGEAAGASPSIELAAGRYYPVILEMNQIAAMKGRLRFEWTAPHGARYLIPRALLFLPSEKVASKP